MTVAAALLILAFPTTVALGVLALADPKRRRTRGHAPAAPRRRACAAGLLALCAALALMAAGAGGVVVWGFAVTAGGWALSNGFAILPEAALTLADRISTALVGRAATSGPRWRTTRLRAAIGAMRAGLPEAATRHRAWLPAAAAALALGCILSALATWQATSAGTAAAQRLVTVALLDRLDRGEVARRAATPCLAAIAADRGSGLRDLLSDRDMVLVLPRGRGADGRGANLQRCILAQGGEGTAVSRDGDADRHEIEGATAARIHAAVAKVLLDADALAELSAGDGLLCRRLAAAIGPEVEDLLDALGRDRLYAKADDLLARLPALARRAAARRAGVPCPA